jgi:hypothetical protein
MKLRLRLPAGWAIQSASIGGKPLAMLDDATMDVSGLKARSTIEVNVSRTK